MLNFSLPGMKSIEKRVPNPAYGLILVSGMGMVLAAGIGFIMPWTLLSMLLWRSGPFWAFSAAAQTDYASRKFRLRILQTGTIF